MRALPCLTVLLAGLIAAPAVDAQSTKVYQWKDANGVTHYSDSPPPQAKAQDRRISNRGEPVADEEAELPVENPQCTLAKRNRDVLANSAPVMQDTDGDGKPDTTLDEEGRANQKALADAAVRAYCKPAAAPAGQ